MSVTPCRIVEINELIIQLVTTYTELIAVSLECLRNSDKNQPRHIVSSTIGANIT
nr:hypothetical protein [Staphylococcus capitis]